MNANKLNPESALRIAGNVATFLLSNFDLQIEERELYRLRRALERGDNFEWFSARAYPFGGLEVIIAEEIKALIHIYNLGEGYCLDSAHSEELTNSIRKSI